MYLIISQDYKIKSAFSGDLKLSPMPILETDEVREVETFGTPDPNRYNDIRMFDEDLNLRDANLLVSENLIELTEYEKISDGKIVLLSQSELAIKGLIPLEPYLEELRQAKLSSIGSAYANEFVTGFFHSTALGIDVDYRRNGTKNDLQNIEVLIEHMTDEGIIKTEYKGYQDQKTMATLAKIKLMRKEMLAHSITLFNKKEDLEKSIVSATTIQELEAINW